MVVLASLAAPPLAGATAPQERKLLEAHRPLLRYASAERFFAQPVSLPPSSAEVREGNRVYGHVAEQAGERWLQYWLFYAYNPQDRGVLRTGRHEGDWELVQIRVDRGGRPQEITLSQHSWAESCAWDELERAPSAGSQVPVVYVANGSHANYAHAGEHGRPFPDPTDEADGNGRELRPRLTVVGDRHPGWIRYPGPWGGTEAGMIPGESPSPLGPRFQATEAWSRPATFNADLARPCGAGAPGRPWQTPLALLLAATLCGLAVFAIRRRR